MGVRQRLLMTPANRVSPELGRLVDEFCRPLEMIRAAYVGLVEITRDFEHPHEQLAVAFELVEPSAETEEGDRELRQVTNRFYETMPEDVQKGGCNFLEPGALMAWSEKARQVFSR